MSDIYILGSGGHARVLAEALRAAGNPVAGFVDQDADDAFLASGPNGIQLANGIGSVGDASRRRAIYERFQAAGFPFLTVVHPSATIASDVVLDAGAQVMAGAVLQSGVHIGTNAIVNTGALVDHDGRIGAHTHIATGARLAGKVTVDTAAHIGAGATVIQGKIIGELAIVAAGAVVVCDVPPRTLFMGVPAKEKS